MILPPTFMIHEGHFTTIGSDVNVGMILMSFMRTCQCGSLICLSLGNTDQNIAMRHQRAWVCPIPHTQEY